MQQPLKGHKCKKDSSKRAKCNNVNENADYAYRFT